MISIFDVSFQIWSAIGLVKIVCIAVCTEAVAVHKILFQPICNKYYKIRIDDVVGC